MPLQEYKNIKNEENEIKSYITDLKENLDWFVEDINKD